MCSAMVCIQQLFEMKQFDLVVSYLLESIDTQMTSQNVFIPLNFKNA